MLHFLDQFNAVIGVLLFSAYLYQVFYTLYGLVVCPRDRRKAKRPNSTPSRRYAALICARNEEHVIGELVARQGAYLKSKFFSAQNIPPPRHNEGCQAVVARQP